MSYCRMGCDGSDVYVIQHCSGFYQCVFCNLNTKDGSYDNKDVIEFLNHLYDHRSNGDTVPGYTFKNIIKDIIEDRKEK